MKIAGILLAGLPLVAQVIAAAPLYDCNSPRPEVAGFHNMVLFGAPGDQLYVYHLPLFVGQTNGTSGHVLMHVYQGLWSVEVDAATKSAYDLKFLAEKTAGRPFPFFSIGPKGNRFKVPEMICDLNFSLSALAVYGHVESNPDFPQPQALTDQLSAVRVRETIFARRFDGSAKPGLTYIIFGTTKQYYMAHLLTDDESSFDQILAVEVLDVGLKNAVESAGRVLITIPITPENELVSLGGGPDQSSPNNKWKLPVDPLGKTLRVMTEAGPAVTGQIKVVGEIYFNNNADLRK